MAIMSLPSFLRDKGMTISNSLGDGHCLLYSVVKSWNKQLSDNPPIDLEYLKTILVTVTLSDPDSYLGFFIPPTHENLVDLMMNYLHNKHYNNAVGDAAPLMIANCCHVNIAILNEGYNHQFEMKLLHSSSPCSQIMYLHRIGDHFNAIIPLPTVPCFPNSVSTSSLLFNASLTNTGLVSTASVIPVDQDTISECTQVRTNPSELSSGSKPQQVPYVSVIGRPIHQPSLLMQDQNQAGHQVVRQKLAYSRNFLLSFSQSYNVSQDIMDSLARHCLLRANCESFQCVSQIPVYVSRHRRSNRQKKVESVYSRKHSNLVQVKISKQVKVVKPSKCLSVALLNARSVNNKTLVINDFILENKLDLVALTETWLTDGALNTLVIGELVPPGYSVINVPRKSGIGGGGSSNL